MALMMEDTVAGTKRIATSMLYMYRLGTSIT
jgi:hypothetical protein